MIRAIRRRVYLQIYLAFVGVALFALFVTAGVSSLLFDSRGRIAPSLASAATFIVEDLPEGPGLAAALDARAERLGMHLTLRGADGAVIAATATPAPAPRDSVGHWFGGSNGPGILVPLGDGRWFGAALDHARHGASARGTGRHLGVLILLGLAVGVGCLPIARRITRRIERLRRGVEDWGSGDLTRRVTVCGGDEVADLARSFNRAADRIEDLVEKQRRMLASASHELRSPLARLRMAVELMGEGHDLTPGAIGDIEELDSLIGELLLAARMDAPREGDERVAVDLAPIVMAEAERVGAIALGADVARSVQGDPRLLRRLVRNLLENARKHGGGGVEIVLEARDGGVRIAVQDRGPGVPEELRERIFDPFFRPDEHSEGRDGGVGLGLALVRRIAEHHGGEARCLAREGGGARFEVDL